MKATAWENEGLELNAAPQNGNEESATTPNNLTTVKELTLRLLREVQCISEVRPSSFENGLDFYDEVTRFEIDLIKRALLLTAGHQGRAARLLNLRATTLNSKIKHYGISLEGFVIGYHFSGTDDNGTRQHA
ncbi:MAG: helix-turn-helix domain-containing protein [Pyrinomonadaceae bacterium]